MTEEPGQEPGHAADTSANASAGATGGLTWGEYVEALVASRGTLAAVAQHLCAQQGYASDVETAERALRRLRGRGHLDGGIWGRRALRVFGLPSSAVERVRWMGHYHSPFTSLPTTICAELLRAWDRPPVSESPARIWVQLGLASVALRRRDLAQADVHLDQARLAVGSREASAAARAELGLVAAFRLARDNPAESARLLADTFDVLAEAAASGSIDATSLACLQARLVDQQAYWLNKPPPGIEADHAAAHALYAALPDTGPAFAICRRHNGMGWSALRLGRDEEAVAHAQRSVEVAGDSGNLRLRAMALKLLAAASGPDTPEAGEALARAERIGELLADDTLIARMQLGGR